MPRQPSTPAARRSTNRPRVRRPGATNPAPTAAPAGVEAIYERLLTAIHERRLAPGVQLVEEKLGSIFGVSRTLVRQAIARLAHDGIVTLHRNRGAFVSSPSIDETRAVFEARRLIEPWLARRLAGHASAAQVKRLREHVQREAQARAANDRRSIVRLSGEFHQLMADMAGNTMLARTMRELTSLTCLAIVLYDRPGVPACPYDEHGALVQAIERGDANEAARGMIEHLDHVEGALDLSRQDGTEVNLEDALA
jgi:DNA-binding GntR family transcriptional regulator